MEEYITNKKEILDELANLMSSDKVISSLIDIHREILVKKEIVLNQASYTKILNKIKNVDVVNHEDVEVTVIHTGNICPFSQKKVTNPYKNSCGHIYEKSELSKYLGNKQCKCPSVGCNALVDYNL